MFRSLFKFVMVSILLLVLVGNVLGVAAQETAQAQLTTDVVFTPVVTVLLIVVAVLALIVLFFGSALVVMARSAVNALPPSVAGTIITEANKNSFKATVDAALTDVTARIPGKLDDYIAEYLRDRGFELADDFFEPLPGDTEGDDLGNIPSVESLTKGYTAPPPTFKG